jgi:hypothetical protein
VLAAYRKRLTRSPSSEKINTFMHAEIILSNVSFMNETLITESTFVPLKSFASVSIVFEQELMVKSCGRDA